MPSGLILLHKDAGMTSHTAVARLRRLYGGEKAGHTGTLDPMATGILPVLLGRAVKASEYITEGDKHYIATLRLGMTTDTEDTTGTTLTQTDLLPTEEEVLRAAESFVGTLSQVPPMYSAIKVGGRRLMDMARAGETVERAPRAVTVYRLSVTRLSACDYSLDVVCSKGTYIRTLCADIGAHLGCGGVMASLCRAEAAGFSLSDAHTLAEIEAMDEAARAACLIPTDDLFPTAPAVTLSDFFAHLARNGQAVEIRKLRVSEPAGTRMRLYDASGFFALAEVTEEEPPRLRVLKLFAL